MTALLKQSDRLKFLQWSWIWSQILLEYHSGYKKYRKIIKFPLSTLKLKFYSIKPKSQWMNSDIRSWLWGKNTGKSHSFIRNLWKSRFCRIKSKDMVNVVLSGKRKMVSWETAWNGLRGQKGAYRSTSHLKARGHDLYPLPVPFLSFGLALSLSPLKRQIVTIQLW